MLKQKRLIRIETSLTPKQAVMLWLRQEHQGKISHEYARWLIQRPPSAAPRPRVGKQVADAIRAAMKGQEPGRINHAVRQGQMYADFLIMLVNRTNWVILNDSEVRWLKIALFFERLRNAALSSNEAQAVNEWAVILRGFVTDLLSLQAANELICNKYFEGEVILLKDVLEELEQQIRIVKNMMEVYDRIAIAAGQPERATSSESVGKIVSEQTSARADYIVALAKSKMLDDFDEPEAADAILKPYFLEGLTV